MGRCYEFGVSIDPSSELAMVVAPEGGHCVCPSTGATCPGRFAGCTAILSQPGRISPNAPEWALGINRAEASSVHPQPAHVQPQATPPGAPQQFPPAAPAGFQKALALAEDRPSGRNTDADLVEMRGALEALADHVAQLTQRPQSATIEDLAEAVVLLRTEQGDSAATNDVTSLEARVEAVSAQHETLSTLPKQMTNIEQTLQELAISVSSVASGQPDGTLFEESMQMLGRAVLELRGSTSDALGALRATQANAADSLEGLRDEVRELAKGQHRETNALRNQFTEMYTSVEQRWDADLSGEQVATALNQMKLDLARLQPESPEMVAATQLADTINTLRDAGVEDISAAHLIHALQGDLRSIRGEVQSVHDRIDAMSANMPLVIEVGVPQNA
jgi:hypothetical protein